MNDNEIPIEQDIIERAQRVLRDALDSRDEKVRVGVAKEIWKTKFGSSDSKGITINLNMSGFIEGIKKMREIKDK